MLLWMHAMAAVQQLTKNRPNGNYSALLLCLSTSSLSAFSTAATMLRYPFICIYLVIWYIKWENVQYLRYTHIENLLFRIFVRAKLRTYMEYFLKPRDERLYRLQKVVNIVVLYSNVHATWNSFVWYFFARIFSSIFSIFFWLLNSLIIYILCY